MKKTLLGFVILFGAMVFAQAQVPSYVPSNGLLAWYPFNGNTNDESNTGNSGTNYSAMLTSDRHGLANSAYYFNGVFTYIKVDAPSFAFGSGSTFTYSLWMNKTGGTGVAMMLGSGVANNFVSLFGGGATDFRFGTNKQSFSWIWASCQHTLNVWDHYVGTYDAGTMNLYKNGVFESTALFTHTNVNSTNLPLYIGKDVTTEYFSGSLDDIGIWERVLSTDEIQTLFNSCEISVTTHPGNQTVNLTDTASFTTASNYANASYQWQIESGMSFQNISNAGQYSGANTSNLKVMNAVFANNNAKFRCVVSEGVCKDTTDVAVLTVNNNVGMGSGLSGSSCFVFPNPAGDVLLLHADVHAIEFSVTDLLGREMMRGEISGEITKIDLHKLSPGLYIIHTMGANPQSIKFVKQ